MEKKPLMLIVLHPVPYDLHNAAEQRFSTPDFLIKNSVIPLIPQMIYSYC